MNFGINAVDLLTKQISKEIDKQIFNKLKKELKMPSEYRAGTYWKNPAGDHIYLHDGYKTADGYCMVCFLNKKKGLIEWSSGRGNLCYSGEMIPASAVDIQDLMMKMTYERQKYYYGSY